MFQEKRRAERIEILGPLGGEVTVFQPVKIAEISLGGVQVETDFPMQLESLHDFRLSLGDITVVVKGRVTHCRIADVDHERVTYKTGVELVAPSDHVREAIGSYIERLKGSRGPAPA